MSPLSLNDIKASTEKTVGFVEWLAEVLRSKNWVTKLLLLDVIFFTIFNPLLFPQILKLFGIDRELPKLYSAIFWLAIGIIFIIALIIAIRTRPQKAEAPEIDLTRRSAIKGLRPFNFEDAEIFAQLQREQSTRECFDSITAPDFRFGVLCGESGCGKTSFLQAGLIPRLKGQCQCVYVKFIDLDPLDSIRQALFEQAQLPQTTIEGDDLLSLLQAIVQINSKPLVLIFDQFEQFFVHHKLKKQREPFIQALETCYKKRPPLPVKIIVCVRGDFKYRLDELQKAIGYSLGPQDSFTFEKFTPHQAAEIFHVISETEGIACDADFVREIVEQQLAHEDGLISPVDIQIFAWMIRGQKTAEDRAFNRHAFQQLGGIEGLLERFLSRVLEVRETEERRQSAIKILLALTDLERNVRAGVLTVENLQQKLAGAVSKSELTETVQWLARGDVRLITPSKLGENLGYELAHERLIPALRKLAGKELSQADQANQLLNRRTNEWLGNERDNHYLLRWNELRKVKKQKKFLLWGENEKAKKDLIAISRMRQKRQFRAIVGSLILFLILWMVWPNVNNRIIEPRQRKYRIQELRSQFVFVEGDTFKMGNVWNDSREDSVKSDFILFEDRSDETPVHEVILSDFKISKYEITNQQYCDFLNSLNKSALKVTDWLDIFSEYCHIKRRIDGKFRVRMGFEEYPVVTVSWYGAVAFCNYLSEHFGDTLCYNLNDWSCDLTANGFRLPTEAEWEFVARGGYKSKGYQYSGNDSPDLVAWYSENSGRGPHEVGTKQSNELGLYDMSGNVWEWCNDWYDERYYHYSPNKNPKGPETGDGRVVRGGSFGSRRGRLRCAYREWGDIHYRSDSVGFRVVCGT